MVQHLLTQINLAAPFLQSRDAVSAAIAAVAIKELVAARIF
jgi:hypothetical protein